MTRSTLLALATSAALGLPGTAAGQAQHYPLESTEGLRLHNVDAEPATLHGKKGLRLTIAQETARRMERMSPEERRRFQAPGSAAAELLARIEDLEFSRGVIEAEIAGAPGPGAGEGTVALWLGPGTVAHFRNLRVEGFPTTGAK